jgi:hypothetical protein
MTKDEELRLLLRPYAKLLKDDPIRFRIADFVTTMARLDPTTLETETGIRFIRQSDVTGIINLNTQQLKKLIYKEAREIRDHKLYLEFTEKLHEHFDSKQPKPWTNMLSPEEVYAVIGMRPGDGQIPMRQIARKAMKAFTGQSNPIRHGFRRADNGWTTKRAWVMPERRFFFLN